MPIYDMKCSTCGVVYEVFLSIREFEDSEKTGMFCSTCHDGVLHHELGTTPNIPRTNLRLSDKQRRKIK
jgi:predicted nucleic acid-binding Zn ribbon protein